MDVFSTHIHILIVPPPGFHAVYPGSRASLVLHGRLERSVCVCGGCTLSLLSAARQVPYHGDTASQTPAAHPTSGEERLLSVTVPLSSPSIPHSLPSSHSSLLPPPFLPHYYPSPNEYVCKCLVVYMCCH